ncbi:MAG: HRDC domain-containing protein [Eubacterium sp.]|nr:HRDC domain-containing protein [Eubacterium sp.]
MATTTIKCPSCGEILEFDSSRESGFCNYCGVKIQLNNPAKARRGEIADEKQRELIAGAVSNYEKAIAKIILLCVDNLEFGLGANKLCQVLSGKQTRFITEYGLQNNISFSLLKQFSSKEIKYILNLLTSTEYLYEEEIERYGVITVYKVAAKGYVFLKEDEELECSFIDAITASDFIELNAEELEVYERLRQLRNTIAKENDIPAYVVCGEMPLRIIAKELPETPEEFLAIKGIGKGFIEKYYDYFIKNIRKADKVVSDIDRIVL